MGSDSHTPRTQPGSPPPHSHTPIHLRFILCLTGIAVAGICVGLVSPTPECGRRSPRTLQLEELPRVRLSQNPVLQVWVESPMKNVLRHSEPSSHTSRTTDAPKSLELCAIRNEHACAQIVLRSPRRMDGIRLKMTDLVPQTGLPDSANSSSGVARIDPSNFTWNVVGYVPVRKNTPKTSASELVARAPNEFPDPLLEKDSFSLAPNQNQPVWLTYRIPPDTPPGEYQGSIEIVMRSDFVPTSRDNVPVKLTVLNATLPSERHFGFTSWFSPGDLAKQHGVRVWSEEFWELLPTYARNLVEHRQTMILTPMNLVRITRETNGCLSFDFRQFDRWCKIFLDAGIQTIEGKELGHRVGKWTSPTMRFHKLRIDDPDTSGRGIRRPLSNDAALRAFFKTLQKHLEQQGWLDRFVMHVADEPTRYNCESWRKMAHFLRAAAPRLRRIEANQTTDLDGDIDISVPQLDSFNFCEDKYLTKRSRYGNQLWFYTCMVPNGRYANRFIDYPLMKTRLLPWIAARYGLTGYLQWGYNYWSSRPFQDVERGNLPPGDSFVVYPGKDKPLNSLRWEMFREGIEDYECLLMLQKRLSAMKSPSLAEIVAKRFAGLCLVNPTGDEAIRTIAARVVQAPDRYDLSVEHFEELHRELRKALE